MEPPNPARNQEFSLAPCIRIVSHLYIYTSQRQNLKNGPGKRGFSMFLVRTQPPRLPKTPGTVPGCGLKKERYLRAQA